MSTHKAESVVYPMAPAAFACFRRYGDLNAVQATGGEVQLSPQFRALLSAAHHVLGGGRIDVRVVTPGRAEIVDELNTYARAAADQANAISREAGVYMTAHG